MSLYFEASDILANVEAKGGSLKNRIFGKKDLKSSPGAIFALVAETTKWSSVLKEVIEKSDILKLEKKVGFLCRLCSLTISTADKDNDFSSFSRYYI
jgi:putative methyltransferase